MNRSDVRDVLVLLGSATVLGVCGWFVLSVLTAQRGLSVLCLP